MKKVLFVCTGNTCRSPMAEALLATKGKEGFEVKSAGVSAMYGSRANPHARHVLKQKGIPFDEHQSQPVTDALIQWADIIYTMTENHKRILLELFPQAVDKVMTLKESVMPSEQIERIWNQWDEMLTEIETTRAMYMQRLNNPHLTEDEKEKIKSEMDSIIEKTYENLEKLEKSLPQLDIMDPFGGSIKEYEKVCLEIEQLIDMLIKKETEDG